MLCNWNLTKFDIITLLSSDCRARALKLSKHLKKGQKMFCLHFAKSNFKVFFGTFLLTRKIKTPHTGKTRPSCTCVIKEYRYHTISLRKYHGWCQYLKAMSIVSKTEEEKNQEGSKTVNTITNGQHGQDRTKNGQKMVKTGQKR